MDIKKIKRKQTLGLNSKVSKENIFEV